MRISVVIDNYNYEQYLSQAIDSALAQTWHDMEVIVIDDGSTDGSQAVMEYYGDRITPIVQSNSGQAAALTNGFAQTTGDVVIFLDADDLLEPDTAAKVAASYAADTSVGRVQWALERIDGQGRRIGSPLPAPRMMPSGDLRKHIVRHRTHVWPPMSGNAFPRSVLERLMPIPTEYRLGGDLYLAELSALLGPIVSLETPGGSYRIHQSNNFATEQLSAQRLRTKIEATMQTHQYARKLCAELGIDFPESSTKALDVAFIGQRLASLRLEPKQHPLEKDRRSRLVARGLYAAIRHPQHPVDHKAKRMVWLVGVGFGGRRMAERLIRRLYFRPGGN